MRYSESSNNDNDNSSKCPPFPFRPSLPVLCFLCPFLFVTVVSLGVGIYIDDASFSRYRRVVQRLAQQGKLAVVFSDESLVS